MATYLAHDALCLPAASLLANSGLCVNIEFEIWLLLGVNVATTFFYKTSNALVALVAAEKNCLQKPCKAIKTV